MRKKKFSNSKRFAALFFLVWFAGSCNYNYFLGGVFEERGWIENANLEYQRALNADPDDEDFLDAYQRTSKLTAEEMEERYRRFLPENLYLQAYHLMYRALVKDPENKFFNEERKKWTRVLLVGKVVFDFKKISRRLEIQDKMEFRVRLNTPNQDRLISAEISLENGLFYAEDFLYQPNESFLMLYSLNSVGIYFTSILDPQQNITGNSFRSFINYRTPVLAKTSGKLDRSKKAKQSILKSSAPSEAKTDVAEDDFHFLPDSISYSIEFKGDRVSVETDANSLEYLPQKLVLNSEDNRALLDFGDLQIRFFDSKDEWGIHRNKDNSYLQEFKNYLILYPYFFESDGSYPYVMSGN